MSCPVVGELEAAGVPQHVRVMTNEGSRSSWKGHSPYQVRTVAGELHPRRLDQARQRDLVLQPLDLFLRDARSVSVSGLKPVEGNRQQYS